MIVSTEDMSEKTSETLNQIFKFLGTEQFDIKKSKKEKSRNYLKMNQNTRDKLIEFFKPHNDQLYNMIEKKFQWDI